MQPDTEKPAQATTGRCATCRHWDAEPHSENMQVHRCRRVLEWWEATSWDDDGERVWKPEAADVLAFTNDGSSYRADLLTRPEFGCVMWEASDAG